MFEMLRIDFETVIVHPTTTRIHCLSYRAGTEVTCPFGLLLTVRAQPLLSSRPLSVVYTQMLTTPSPFSCQCAPYIISQPSKLILVVPSTDSLARIEHTDTISAVLG